MHVPFSLEDRSSVVNWPQGQMERNTAQHRRSVLDEDAVSITCLLDDHLYLVGGDT